MNTSTVSSLSHTSSRQRRIALFSLLYCLAALHREARAEDHVTAKYQEYREDDGRIQVIAKYVGAEKKVTDNLTVRAEAVNDAITGATPTGSPNPDGTVSYSELEEERNGVVVDLVWETPRQVTTAQYARSKESDYLSKGYALTTTRFFNKKNVAASLGVSFNDDSIYPSFLSETKTKDTWDYFLGVNLTASPNTVVTANFSHGKTDGYISDPYKLVIQNFEVFPGVFIPLSYPENRPNTRTKNIFLVNAKRYFEKLHGNLDAEYRFYTDTFGIDSHTVTLEWYQKIGDHLIVAPSFRFYRQSAADFYRINVDDLGFEPSIEPDGTGVAYSADYRLSKMDTITAGLKLVYKVGENVSLDAHYERYRMYGRDGITPQEEYAQASIYTIGASWRF